MEWDGDGDTMRNRSIQELQKSSFYFGRYVNWDWIFP